jgi:hypothetical protein
MQRGGEGAGELGLGGQGGGVEGQAFAEGVERGRGRPAGRLPLQPAGGRVEVQLGSAGAGEWPVVFFAEGEAFAGAADVQLDAWFCQPSRCRCL